MGQFYLSKIGKIPQNSALFASHTFSPSSPYPLYYCANDPSQEVSQKSAVIFQRNSFKLVLENHNGTANLLN